MKRTYKLVEFNMIDEIREFNSKYRGITITPMRELDATNVLEYDNIGVNWAAKGTCNIEDTEYFIKELEEALNICKKYREVLIK